MKTNDDDDLEGTRKVDWSKLYVLADVASKVYDEEQRAKKGKSKMVSEEEEEERLEFLDYVPRKIRSSLRYSQPNYENLNGASTSSSSVHHLGSFEPCSSLYYNTGETKSPPNPNSQSSCLTENTKRKRCAVVSKRSSNGKFKKTKVTCLPRIHREAPEWLVELMKRKDIAEDPILVFERTSLTASDVNTNLSRLLIPFSMLTRNDFLTPEEIEAIERKGIDEENIGLGTILVNENSEMWGLRFKIWVMEKKDSGNGTLNYALNWGWNDVVKGNNLKAGHGISLWCFRRRGVLCFALEHRAPLSTALMESHVAEEDKRSSKQ